MLSISELNVSEDDAEEEGAFKCSEVHRLIVCVWPELRSSRMQDHSARHTTSQYLV